MIILAFSLRNISKWLQQAGDQVECCSPAELKNQRSEFVATEIWKWWCAELQSEVSI